MPAQSDHKQKIRFHFGNAAIDLAHLLPPDEYVPEEVAPTSVEEILARSELLIHEVRENRKKLAYVLADIKRQLG